MRHTRYGWWLEEAQAKQRIEAAPPLEEDGTADVVIVGGGYLGLWTAWHLKQLEPGADVIVLEAGLAGHGPSGRNGGFVTTLWDDLPILRDRVGDERAVAVCRATARAVDAIGEWCEAEGVDAWYRRAPYLQVATSPAQVGGWTDEVEACGAVGAPEEVRPLTLDEVRSRCDSPLFVGGGALLRTAATVHPARLSLGLRERVRSHGVRLYERAPVRKVTDQGVETSAGHRVGAAAVVLAVNNAIAGFAGFRMALAVGSSHMVVTEPVPEILADIGWTGGEPITDGRTLLHYMRTTRDGRIALGWGGGRMGFGGRRRSTLEVDPAVVAEVAASLLRFFPQLAGRRLTNAWGGPIDVSPTHLPIFGTRRNVHYGFGFTGNGVGPSHLGGEILARLALDRRDDVTRLPLVEPDRKLFPPEPLRWLGGSVTRAALVRKDAAEDRGGTADPLTRFVAGVPRRLGLRLPR